MASFQIKRTKSYAGNNKKKGEEPETNHISLELAL